MKCETVQCSGKMQEGDVCGDLINKAYVLPPEKNNGTVPQDAEAEEATQTSGKRNIRSILHLPAPRGWSHDPV